MRSITRPSLFGVIRRACDTPRYEKYTCITWRYYSDSKTRTYDVSFLSFLFRVSTNHVQDAINHLNTLQTPYAELKRQWDAGIIRGAEDLQHTKDCFARLGYVVCSSLISASFSKHEHR